MSAWTPRPFITVVYSLLHNMYTSSYSCAGLLALASHVSALVIFTEPVNEKRTSYPFSELVAFGDELSDNGNGSYAHGITGDSSNNYGFGTWTDGPVAVSYLADLLNVPLTDYAFGGCCGGASFGMIQTLLCLGLALTMISVVIQVQRSTIPTLQQRLSTTANLCHRSTTRSSGTTRLARRITSRTPCNLSGPAKTISACTATLSGPGIHETSPLQAT